MHQRFHRYLSLKDFLPGTLNTMADAASRLPQLSDEQFLMHFNASFPQALPWHLYRIPPTMLSSATSALRKKRLPLELFLREPPHLLTATFVSLEFSTQKNGVRGEVIGLGRSGDPNFCPVLAAAR